MIRRNRYSRTGASRALVLRAEPTIWSRSPTGPLSERELESYDERGFVTLEGVVGPSSIERLRRIAEREARDDGVSRGGPRSVGTAGAPLHERHPEIAALTCDITVAGAARQILADEARVFESWIAGEPVTDDGYPAFRSDFERWHHEGRMPWMRALSVFVFLSAYQERDGPMRLIPGSHRLFIPRAADRASSAEDGSHASVDRARLPNPEVIVSLSRTLGVEVLQGSPGTVVLLDTNVLYAPARSAAPQDRTNLVFVLNASSNAPVE